MDKRTIMKIGIVGQGYVGTAVKTVFEKYYDIETYDLDKDKCSVDYLEDLVELTNIIFVCVPTPMKKDGSCDTSIVEAVVKDINDMVVSRNVSGRIVAIKSTVPPTTTERLNKECGNIPIVFNPEFLTEANFIEDFKNKGMGDQVLDAPLHICTYVCTVCSLRNRWVNFYHIE